MQEVVVTLVLKSKFAVCDLFYWDLQTKSPHKIGHMQQMLFFHTGSIKGQRRNMCSQEQHVLCLVGTAGKTMCAVFSVVCSMKQCAQCEAVCSVQCSVQCAV